MEYALLYTFSTIPQTLAAALGVLAAFVLYRLQSDSSTMWQDASFLISAFGNQNSDEFHDLLGRQRYTQLLATAEHLFATTVNRPQIGSGQDLAYKRLKGNLAARAKILQALKGAFLVTAAVILLCVIEIPLAHKVYPNPWISVTLLIGAVGTLALALWLYWVLVRSALWSE